MDLRGLGRHFSAPTSSNTPRPPSTRSSPISSLHPTTRAAKTPSWPYAYGSPRSCHVMRVHLSTFARSGSLTRILSQHALLSYRSSRNSSTISLVARSLQIA
ncbi:hypothetical protein FOTG_17594 [Fusarium oxysporum f. sp. vasinfectum 25433]|uniref:Uncharacterized protein n=1 Tax=Fusarium oxysporum f. sp. vasinfectum 25433 TaxID=1089449 RepID=X0KZ77_FUSOX|nr:hypothetical protein FOTG_17594 [Fusarium oxysporum f. sp. vasinfectum 25433]